MVLFSIVNQLKGTCEDLPFTFPTSLVNSRQVNEVIYRKYRKPRGDTDC